MKIEIRGYVAASDLLNSEPGVWDAIFILDSKCELNSTCQQLCNRHLLLSFDDVETPSANLVPPNLNHLEQALNFAKTASKLLVTCRAGQSRSVAVGLFIAAKFFDTQRAISLLDPARHLPNELIISLAVKQINDPKFSYEFSRWKNQAQGKFDKELARIAIEELLKKGATNQISVDHF